MNEKKIKKYIEDLAKRPKNYGILEFFFIILSHFFAKWILILKCKNEVTFNELLKALDHKNQEIVSHVVDILGKIRNRQAIPYLREMLKRNDLWGVTVCSLGVALIKLGDDRLGIDFLKEKIVDPRIHRHTRLIIAKALIHLKIKNVFGKDEKIDFGGETMTTEWSNVLRELVQKLRARK